MRAGGDVVDRVPASDSVRRDVVVPGAVVVAVTAGLVVGLDRLLLARVHAGTDYALRLSVILPYLGVDATYVLARALGITALVTAATSVALGLHLGQERAGPAPVTPRAVTVHRVLGLVTLALVAGHATVPYLSTVPPYGGWATALAPFDQPFSWGTKATVFESLGIVAFYILVLVGPTYYLWRRTRRWSAVHRLAFVAYGLAVLHALFLGSDFYVAGPVRVALLAVQVPITALLARRMWATGSRRRGLVATVGAGAALTASAALAVLAGLGMAGAPLAGLRL